MKWIWQLLLLAALISVLGLSCKKWSDPVTDGDPRLTNPYCNDPAAVNYNWGFPGTPDNTKCFYPNSLFEGSYSYIDSVYLTNTGDFLYEQPVSLKVISLSGNKIAVLGFCSVTDSILLTANKNYEALVDTVIGDTVTTRGQYWCRATDTVTGSMTVNRLDSVLIINFTIVSDTGITNHFGRVRKS